jgi:hypothetical protein
MKTAYTLPAAAMAALLLVTGCNKPAEDPNKTTTSSGPGPTVPTPVPEASPPPRVEAANTVGEAVTDATLTTKVKAALADDVSFKTLKLDVDSKDGVVTITGTVPTADQRLSITKVAEQVQGVKSVDNRVEIKPS